MLSQVPSTRALRRDGGMATLIPSLPNSAMLWAPPEETTLPFSMFIRGDPRKPATKRFLGLSKSSSRAPAVKLALVAVVELDDRQRGKLAYLLLFRSP